MAAAPFRNTYPRTGRPAWLVLVIMMDLKTALSIEIAVGKQLSFARPSAYTGAHGSIMIIYSRRIVNFFTLGRAVGITLFPFIFVVPELRGDPVVINHERIHLRQQSEMLVLAFFLIYILSLLWNLLRFRNFMAAYMLVFFEREAYDHEHESDYLTRRRPFASLAYAFGRKC